MEQTPNAINYLLYYELWKLEPCPCWLQQLRRRRQSSPVWGRATRSTNHKERRPRVGCTRCRQQFVLMQNAFTRTESLSRSHIKRSHERVDRILARDYSLVLATRIRRAWRATSRWRWGRRRAARRAAARRPSHQWSALQAITGPSHRVIR